jgi:hypothetical protein
VNLTEFLNARVDEDEAAAEAVQMACRDMREPWPPEQAPGRGGPALTAFLVQFSEGRMLREVAAKRAILAAYEANDRDVDLHLGPYPRKHGEWDGLQLAVRHLAAAYSDHPDYSPAWSVSTPS